MKLRVGVCCWCSDNESGSCLPAETNERRRGSFMKGKGVESKKKGLFELLESISNHINHLNHSGCFF